MGPVLQHSSTALRLLYGKACVNLLRFPSQANQSGMGEDPKAPYFDKGENTGIAHLLNATRFSLRGIVQAVKRESAFRQELGVFLCLIPLAVWLADSLLTFVFLMSTCVMVLVVELLNSAVEAAVDRAGLDYNELAGLAKDYGSAAVMLTLLVTGAVWLTFLINAVTD